MGYSENAIRKGMTGEYLAKAFFSKEGYSILLPDSNETSYDFVAEKDGVYTRIQVKTDVSFGDLVRFRNKHGQNRAYSINDYDVLCGVWIERNQIYLFHSIDVNDHGFGETITVATHSGRPLSNHKRLAPYYSGNI